MPTRVHDCHQPWVVSQKFEWTVSGLITAAEFHFLNVFVGTTINFVGGPYSGAIKEPDLLIQPDNQHLPSVIIESGWSESVPRLRDDMNLWLVGGGGKVRAAIILSWQRLSNTNQVRGNLELYTLDRNGMPQHNTDLAIFPSPTPAVAAAQQLILTRREVFGDHVPPGRNPTDQLPFSINILRGEARDALQLMGLIPA
ncbi:uncharacterized protein TRUGW13939_00229 [Talaromyces rugulosus]|uniref:Uncharacterized protein n=1 Tax=Talaromyces rugulosus TaxID=121627 RepID=A0A7H8QIZ7_TALRU|nr:uncharacterized protein TRUGW13939_00229 [Talaromyces rugulosus]QKX53153.1 hypothetical protein TRUGW13939_00229 [Talaromyces rugulosus]